jgi:vacuolar-type H+-ATPase subunit E/Vma4
MTDTQQTAPQSEPPPEVLAYLRDEQARRCAALRIEARERIQEIEAAGRDQQKRLLDEGRRAFPALRRSVTIAVAGPARREAEAVAARKMGDAVERILVECDGRLREFAASSVFSAVLDSLIREVVEGAMEMLHLSDPTAISGRLHTSPADEAVCRTLVTSMGLALEVVADDTVWGGVELWVNGDTDRIRNTLESRMARQDGDLRMVATQRIHQKLKGTTEAS